MQTEVLTKAVKDLKAARKLLEESKGLSRGVSARTAGNQEVDTDSPFAVKFDPVAALNRATNWSSTSTARNYLDQTMLTQKDYDNGCEPYDVSDRSSTKLEHVLMAFDFAILQAEADLRVAKRAAAKAAKQF